MESTGLIDMGLAFLFALTGSLTATGFSWPGALPALRSRLRAALPQMLRKRSIVYVSGFILLQGMIVTLFDITVIGFPAFQSVTTRSLLIGAFMLLGLTILVLAVRAIRHHKEEAVRLARDQYMEHLDSMFDTIRDQRHDFLNHARSILAFAEQNDVVRLQRYTDGLVGEISQGDDILRIGHPAFAALIQAKRVIARRHHIDFDYDFADLDHLNVSVKSIDLVKIIGNLIDNAFDEVQQQQEEENRWVEVGAWLCSDLLHVTVRNPGGPISDHEAAMMFMPGYTTKREGHSGIGLSIVKERIDYYSGTIQVESSEESVVFKLTIPLAHKKAVG